MLLTTSVFKHILSSSKEITVSELAEKFLDFVRATFSEKCVTRIMSEVFERSWEVYLGRKT